MCVVVEVLPSSSQVSLSKEIEQRRTINSTVYKLLLRKKQWDLEELVAESYLPKDVVLEVLKKLEAEKLVLLNDSNHVQCFNDLCIYEAIWRRFHLLNGLFKSDVQELVKDFSVSLVAECLGYCGRNARNRGRSLKTALKKLGWWRDEPL